MKAVVLLSLSALAFTACSRMHPKPVRYVLDGGTTGWVKILYNQQGAPELPVEKGFAVVHISQAMKVVTATRMNPSWEGSEFYFRRRNGQLVKLSSADNDQRRLWGLEKDSDAEGEREVFFVGRQQQFTHIYAAAGDMGTGLLENKKVDFDEVFDTDPMKIETSISAK